MKYIPLKLEIIFWVQVSSHPESKRPESKRPVVQSPNVQASRVLTSCRPESKRPESKRPESSRPESKCPDHAPRFQFFWYAGFDTYYLKKTCFQRYFELIKVIIVKEKCRTVTKRNQKMKKFFSIALLLWRYYCTSFKILLLKNVHGTWLGKPSE